MHWTRGRLAVGTSGHLEDRVYRPVDVAVHGSRCVVACLRWDPAAAGGGRWRLVRMTGLRQPDGLWLLRRRADHSELVLRLSPDRQVLTGALAWPGGRESWRIDLVEPLPVDAPAPARAPIARRGRVRPALAACHYTLHAGQWRNGEARQRDALLLAGRVWQHARLGLRQVELVAADTVVALATGLPGHAAAPAASRIVLDALRRLLVERPELRSDGRPGHRLIAEVQRELQRRLGRRPHGRGAGAGLVLAHLRGASLLVLAIGTGRVVWLGADGSARALGTIQDQRAMLRPQGALPPPRDCPPAFRHPAQALYADGDSDLLALQRLQRTLMPGDCVLLLSPGAVEALVGARCHDEGELLDALRLHLRGARTVLARATRLRGRLRKTGDRLSACAGFLLVDFSGDLASS